MKRSGVIFRVGTPSRYAWKRLGPYTQAQAVEKVKDFAIARVVDYDLSVSLGLPETFDNDHRRTVDCLS